MDHYNNPINKSTPKDISKYKSIRMDSTTCIDDITIYILVENDVIKDAKFDGVGCTISTASTDIMCELIKNKTIKEADYIFEQYNNMIFEKEFDKEALDEALVFVNTSKQAARIKCATIGWNGMQKCLHGEKDEK
ncbi:MAG: SUF system NifU family Fe-S cluster assembly protein [Bacilli bacterium]